jgi:hypothetical protein
LSCPRQRVQGHADVKRQSHNYPLRRKGFSPSNLLPAHRAPRQPHESPLASSIQHQVLHVNPHGPASFSQSADSYLRPPLQGKAPGSTEKGHKQKLADRRTPEECKRQDGAGQPGYAQQGAARAGKGRGQPLKKCFYGGAFPQTRAGEPKCVRGLFPKRCVDEIARRCQASLFGCFECDSLSERRVERRRKRILPSVGSTR